LISLILTPPTFLENGARKKSAINVERGRIDKGKEEREAKKRGARR